MSEEHSRATSSGKTSVGAGLYKLSTYIGQSDDAGNTKVVFQDNNHQLTAIATKAIAKGDEIKTSYTLPVSVAASASEKNQDTAQQSEEKQDTAEKPEEKQEIEQQWLES